MGIKDHRTIREKESGGHCKLRTIRSDMSVMKIIEIFRLGGEPSGTSDDRRWTDCRGGTLGGG